MIKYYAWTVFNRVEKVEILSETEKFVTLASGRRTLKLSGDQAYFDTFQEAKDFLIAGVESDIANLIMGKSKLEATLQKVRELKE